ncbi:LuxR C-terminal-related transcriptional regulator [Janibacter sp. CX7]|jgi:DNA-binding CsgD family transcriptional regulator|uniref:helix-turn-helix transcriptional regulator n=1 Tax=unclassified Janibacter TaxID=2649294 RepID=UPI0020CDD387|nr:LuxR family transcriptional regulator [Janibacter sp. CX7]UTT66736.1 LuxR C-terminal-related transcriptional regulator [Janibacter sp. CX7]
MSGKGIDEYATVVRLVTGVAGASEHVDARLARMSDLLVDLLSSPTGLMVHGAPDGFEVRAVGSAATPAARARMSDELRITGGPDPLLDPIRAGDLEPTTAGLAYGGQAAWQASGKCRGSLEIWGIDQVAALPVRSGTEFVAFLVGRRGEDYGERDLALLTAVQPVVAGLVRLLEPEHLAPPTLHVAQLTQREHEVLCLLAAGHKAATIARHAGCSERTVHRHLAHIYAKLGVTDRLSAVVKAQRIGLLATG